MKTFILIIGIPVTPITATFAQGYIDFSWFGNGIQGVRATCTGWYLQNDYSVEAWMAFGANQPEFSLSPIPSTRTVFIGGPTTTASGSPSTDGSGLWYAGPQDTGYPFGVATIQVRAWYNPNHNLTFEQALSLGYGAGGSALYNINLVSSTDPQY